MCVVIGEIAKWIMFCNGVAMSLQSHCRAIAEPLQSWCSGGKMSFYEILGM